MLYYPWTKLNVGLELRHLLIADGCWQTLEVGFSSYFPDVPLKTEGFEWRSCWTSWRMTTTCRTCGTTGKSNWPHYNAAFPWFVIYFQNFLLIFRPSISAGCDICSDFQMCVMLIPLPCRQMAKEWYFLCAAEISGPRCPKTIFRKLPLYKS